MRQFFSAGPVPCVIHPLHHTSHHTPLTPTIPHITLHSHLPPRTSMPHAHPSTSYQTKSTHYKNSGPPLTFRTLTRGGVQNNGFAKPPPLHVAFLFLRTPPPPKKNRLPPQGGSGIPLFMKKTAFLIFLPFLPISACVRPRQFLGKRRWILKIRERFFLSTS
jgi:hypothetical protein